MNTKYLIHSAKGTTWKDHKYVRKEGKTYIYRNNVSNDTFDKSTYTRIKKSKDNTGKTLEDFLNDANDIREMIENLPDKLEKEYKEDPLKFILNHPQIAKAQAKKYIRQYVNQTIDSFKDKVSDGLNYAQSLIIQNENHKVNMDKDVPSDIDWNKRRS